MTKDIFSKEVTDEVVTRINKLQTVSQPQWGKMNVSQMMAHCSIPYAITFEPEKFKKPNFFMKLLLKNFVRKFVVNEVPYKPNSQTAPYFLVTDERDFEKEKALLIKNIVATQELGRSYFEGLENFSFGKMTAHEWNNMYYKHIDHHLRQFGV